MKKYCAIAMITFVSVLLSLQPSSAASWSKIKDSSGIKVYERAVPGTDLMEYMGVTTIDAKMEVIGEVLRDVPRYNKWLADCYGAQVEKKFSKNDMVIYMVLKPPVIQERDIVLKDRTVYDYANGNALISFQATEEVKIPLEDKRVRVKIMNGLFRMDYLGRAKTKFIYTLKVDPGGDIPKKVAYAVMKGYPYTTLKGLKKMVNDQKYIKAAKGTEEEREIDRRAVNPGAVEKVLTLRLMKYVKNKGALGAVIAADRAGIQEIAKSGGSYPVVEKVTTRIYTNYFSKFVDKSEVDRLKNNKKMIEEITEMVLSDCGAVFLTVDDIVKKYSKK
ncbi:MAG: hypothetical protein JW807_02430 [Spirochaetes bacterium]|nr:hypothetical protein [Spirochaetota bacterium]